MLVGRNLYLLKSPTSSPIVFLFLWCLIIKTIYFNVNMIGISEGTLRSLLLIDYLI